MVSNPYPTSFQQLEKQKNKKTKQKQTRVKRILNIYTLSINSDFFPSSSCYNSSSMWFSGWAFSVGPGNEGKEGKMNKLCTRGLQQLSYLKQKSISLVVSLFLLPSAELSISAGYRKVDCSYESLILS